MNRPENCFVKRLRRILISVKADYNLALTQEKMGDVKNAIESIEKYLAIEQTEEWQNAGRNYYKSLMDLKSQE